MAKNTQNAQASAPDVSNVAVIYLRVSSPHQEQNYSIAQQESDCRAYCEARGYAIHALYNDGWERSYTLNRPGLNKVVDDLRTRRAGVLVVGIFDRFSRDQLQAAAFRYQVVQQYHARVESALQPIASDDPIIAEKLIQDYIFVAALEKQNITRRTQNGRRARARAGKLIAGAFPLYGYLWGDGDEKHGKSFYVVNPETAPVVQRIFHDYAAGVPLRAIAMRLETEHVPTPLAYLDSKGMLPKGRTHSRVWTRGTLHRMLTNPMYIGKGAAYRYANSEREEIDPYTGEARFIRSISMRAPDDAEYVALSADVCPALIDEATWSAVQSRFVINRAEAARHNPDPERALLRSGHIVCGYCGENLIVAHTGDKYGTRYYCRRRKGSYDVAPVPCAGGAFSIQTSIIDADVWYFVKYLLSHPHVIRDAIEHVKSARETEDTRAEERLASYDGLRAKLEADAANLLQGMRETSVAAARALIQKELDKVATQLAEIEEQQKELARDAVSRLAASGQLAELEELTARWGASADLLSYAQKRALLYALGLKVTMWRKGHTPRYVIRCDFEGLRTGLDVSLFEIDDSGLEELKTGNGNGINTGAKGNGGEGDSGAGAHYAANNL